MVLMETLTILIRFFIVFILSLIFGIERQRAHKPVGFGTFIFVAIGSCSLAIAATTIDIENRIIILGSIVTGIGFLGAGALIKNNDKIFGFTTAASIWIFAIFGLIIGVGQYLEGIIIYIFIWMVIIIDKILENKGIGSYRKKITINTNRIINEKDIALLINTKKNLIGINADKKNNKLSLTYLISGNKNDLNSIPQKLFRESWFDSFKVE
jgi:putative Mg2+ transporter-C (MgtC) family protein